MSHGGGTHVWFPFSVYAPNNLCYAGCTPLTNPLSLPAAVSYAEAVAMVRGIVFVTHLDMMDRIKVPFQPGHHAPRCHWVRAGAVILSCWYDGL